MTKKQIRHYLNLGYSEKRKVLRQFYHENADALELVVVYHADCWPIDLMLRVTESEVLTKVLVDGYAVYERTDFGFRSLDPVEVDLQTMGNGGKMWRYHGTLIPYDKVVYLTYSDLSLTDNTSLVEQVMVAGLSKRRHASFVEILVDRAGGLAERFDPNYERLQKIRRFLR